jgi:hypothetical protein
MSRYIYTQSRKLLPLVAFFAPGMKKYGYCDAILLRRYERNLLVYSCFLLPSCSFFFRTFARLCTTCPSSP